eukprot:10167217-Alexandrium_andersonii.AAC.1
MGREDGPQQQATAHARDTAACTRPKASARPHCAATARSGDGVGARSARRGQGGALGTFRNCRSKR